MTAQHSKPWTFQISYWYSLIFSLTFLLYGGVSIVLSVLDREYSTFQIAIIYAAVGIILISLAAAYKELKNWGWYGVIVANAVVVLLALFDLGNYQSIVLLICSLGVLTLLFAPSTRYYLAHTAKN